MTEARLLDMTRDPLRRKHSPPRTEESSLRWIRQYILFNGKRHPKEMGAPELEAVLTHLAIHRKVSASTQNQALSAILFLYRHVLHNDSIDLRVDAVRAKRRKRVPTVLSREEVQRLLASMTGVPLLQAKLLYGSGLRLKECLRLRVKDLDFDRRQIAVRDTKGSRDRTTMLPDEVGTGAADPRERRGQWTWPGLVALCIGWGVPPGRPGMDLAARLTRSPTPPWRAITPP